MPFRRKSPPLTYKVSTSLGQWVVKFNPLGPRDPWYDVKKEHSILQSLYPDLPVPRPIYASTDRDEWMVGTAFIVLEFVEVCSTEVHTHVLLYIDMIILTAYFDCIIVYVYIIIFT